MSEACYADIATWVALLAHPRQGRQARAYRAEPTYVSGDRSGHQRSRVRPALLNQGQRQNAATIIRRLAATAGIARRVTRHALRRSYITVGLLQGVPLREMLRAARHAKADTTVGYDQSERSFHNDLTFVLMAAIRPLTSHGSRIVRFAAVAASLMSVRGLVFFHRLPASFLHARQGPTAWWRVVHWALSGTGRSWLSGDACANTGTFTRFTRR